MRFLHLKGDSTSKSIDGGASHDSSEAPPPYTENGELASAQSDLRTFNIVYEEGGNPKLLRVFENGDESRMLYYANLGSIKMFGGDHMRFKTPSNQDIGTASFHKTGTVRMDLTSRGTPFIMRGYVGSTYSLLNFTSPTSGQTLRWKQPKTPLNIICIDEHDTELAMLHFGQSTKPRGTFEIFDPELAKGGRPLEEVLISGMAFIHITLYMSSYAGGSSGMGMMGGGGGGC